MIVMLVCIIVLCTVVALLAAPSLSQDSVGSTPTSPCPRVFRYAPPGIDPGLWAGVATMSTDIHLHSMWLNIVLDRPAFGFGQLWHWVGNTTTHDNVDFRIYNEDLQIHPGDPLVVRFYVQYDPLNTTPRLRAIRLNGKVICSADTYQRATVDRPVLSNVRQPSSSLSGPRPLKSTQSDNYPVYQRPVNTSTRSSNAYLKPGNSYSNSSATAESVECGIVSGGNDRITVSSYRRGDLPWLVAIYHRQENTFSLRYICGGTLVSGRHVLTAERRPLLEVGLHQASPHWSVLCVSHPPYSRRLDQEKRRNDAFFLGGATTRNLTGHCLRNPKAQTAIKDFVVKVGAHNVNDWTDDITVTRKLVSVSIHEHFDAFTLKNDILILTLSQRVQFNDYIRPACLWSGDTELSRVVGASGIVAGWGVISEEDTDRRDEPHIARATIVSTEDCRASLNTFEYLTSDTTLCAGDRNGEGPCVGSSGAGLFLLHGGRWTLRAMASVSLRADNGNTTCNLNEYVVYTDTAQFLPWIRNILSVQYID